MKKRKIIRISFIPVLAFVFACLLLPYAASQTAQDSTQTAQKLSPNSQNNPNQATQTLNQTAQVGHYSVTLKVLPAETFHGPRPEMIRDGGAPANTVDGPHPPDGHLAAFITEDSKPLQDANVEMSYRPGFSTDGKWITIPVARMHTAGKGPETTHFGNNFPLPKEAYEVRVTVNGTGPVTFRFSR